MASKALWRRIIRVTKLMKVPGQGSYYKLQAKQTIFNYTQEDEPAAVEELVKVSYNEGRPDDLLHDQRGHNQVDFIVRKYGLNESQQSTKKVLGGLSSDNPNHSQASSSSPSGLESSYSPMRYTYCGLTIEVDIKGQLVVQGMQSKRRESFPECNNPA